MPVISDGGPRLFPFPLGKFARQPGAAALLVVRQIGRHNLFLDIHLTFGPERKLSLVGRAVFRVGNRSLPGRPQENFMRLSPAALTRAEYSKRCNSSRKLRCLIAPLCESGPVRSQLSGGADRRPIAAEDPGKKCLQPIEVFLQERIEFVIVALGAADRTRRGRPNPHWPSSR